MNCVQCGAELRPDARFCNRCGTSQPETAPSAAVQPTVAVEQHTAELDDAGQVKRPPRPLRYDDEESAGADDTGADTAAAADNGTNGEAGVVTNPMPAMPPLAGLGATSAGGDYLPLAVHDGDQLSRAASSMLGDAVLGGTEDAGVVSSLEAPEPDAQMPQAAATIPSPSEDLSPTPDAASPSWPLAPGTLAGGRYCIMRVTVAAQNDAPGAENMYLVTDQRGYERCWSCGAEPASAGASEPFCERCGADLLAREYVMTERRLGAPDDEKTVPLGGGDPGGVAFVEAGRLYRVAPRPAEMPAFPAGAYLVAGAACDIGISRHSGRNEDSLGVTVLSLDSDSRRHTLGIFVVADGLGGHANGHEASQAVVRVFTESLLHALALPLTSGEDDPTPDALQKALLAAAQAANSALLAANDTTGADSGSTLVAALVWDETAYVANVGDSRGYVFSDGTLRRLTIDHSLVENLVAGGIIAPEDRYTHPQRNQILRSLGDERKLAVDVFEQRLRPGMRLLFCSDGLWEMVHDDELARLLAETPHPQETADALVRAANTRGGEDNISAIVVEVRA